MSIVLGILTFILILVSVFLVLVVLAQRSKDGGVGAALGGGATEAAFGADTGNVLSKSTIYAAIVFFVLSFGLYLGRIYERKSMGAAAGNALPAMSTTTTTPAPAAPDATAPVTTAPVTVPATTAPATQTPAGTTPAATTAPAPTTTPTPAPETPKK